MTPSTDILKTTLSPFLREQARPGETMIAAVSGGRDSMALLHAAQVLYPDALVACHVNHGLRGIESEKDAELVQRFAEVLGIPFELRLADVRSHAKETQQSLEAAARELRYEALSEVAEKRNSSTLLLGHHSDDQVETVLINFFRGSGTRGLSGMDPVSSRVIGGREILLLRPLLSLSRSDVDDYLEANEIPFRDDESNREDFALRNRIRNRLLPTLTGIFERDVKSAVLRTAELSRNMEAWAASETGELPERGPGLCVETLRDLIPARRDRLLLQWLRESGIPDCGYGEIVRINGILHSDTNPAKVNLPGNHHARRKAGVLFLEFPEQASENHD